MNTNNKQTLELQNKVQITVNGRTFSLPLIHGTMDEWGIDISKLRGSKSVITYDPAYGSTGSCSSAITFIDGEKGVLLYRGYRIEELAKEYSFTESAFLLAYGELPTAKELKNFRSKILSHTVLPKCIGEMIKSTPKDAHPMAILSMAMTRLLMEYPQYSKNDRAKDVNDFPEAYPMLMGVMPAIAAMIHRHRKGLSFVMPDTSMTFAKNFLNMLFSDSDHASSVNDSAAHALMVMLTLHADHEQNCSTSTMRLVGSSGTGYNSLSAAILALWGPSHGGANMEVIKMLNEIHSSGKTVRQFVEAAKDKESGVKLMGFGHRVYKNFDPRAKFIKEACDDLLKELGVEKDPLLGIAKELEDRALSDEYFKARKLYPNFDFYSGIIFKAMGLDPEMFTVMFAIGRTPGWLSHWYEQARDEKGRIGRPRQIYIGPPIRPVPSSIDNK